MTDKETKCKFKEYIDLKKKNHNESMIVNDKAKRI